MLAKDYFDLEAGLSARGIILAYSGFLTEGMLFSLGQTLKQKMALDSTDANVTKRVFSVFVELVQNIIRYSSDRLGEPEKHPGELSAGLVVVGTEMDRFFMVCGNLVDRGIVPGLRERLDELIGMDKEAIKTVYRRKLREPPEESSKGATLGLLEIARRSSAPMEYGFVDHQSGQVFFCLKTYI